MWTLTPKQALTKARDLISNPDRWTTGHYARDDKGNGCDTLDERATCFCAVGALAHVNRQDLGFDTDMPGLEVLQQAADDLFEASPPAVNDHRGHDAILRVFDHAIEQAG